MFALVLNYPPANAEDVRDVGSIPGWGRSLEEKMAIYSSILAWRIQGLKSLAGYSPWGYRVRHDLTNLAQHR